MTARRDGKGLPRFIGKLKDDIQRLHDSLWHEEKEEPDALRSDLLAGTGKLDAFLELDGRLLEPVQQLVDDEDAGPTLFELLYTTLHFALATELYDHDDFGDASRHAAHAAENLSIGLCSAADCFPLLTERESGKISFETYADELAKGLEGLGVDNVRNYAQSLVTVWKLGMEGAGQGSGQMERLACRAVLATAAYCICHAVSIRTALNPPPPDPYYRLPDIVLAISNRGPG